MRERSCDLEFEQALNRCSNLTDIRKVLGEKEKGTDLLKACCSKATDLIRSNFSQLKLKDERFRCADEASNDQVNEIFNQIGLDNKLDPHDGVAKLSSRPRLSHFLKHCCQERTYSFSVKRCGLQNCDMCSQSRLPPEDL